MPSLFSMLSSFLSPLFSVAYFSPNSSSKPSDDSPQTVSIELQLVQFSTGAPHPFAARPTLHIHDVDLAHGKPGISIEIVDEILALSLVYWNYPLRDMDTLHLYNWKSGVTKMVPIVRHMSPDVLTNSYM